MISKYFLLGRGYMELSQKRLYWLCQYQKKRAGILITYDFLSTYIYHIISLLNRKAKNKKMRNDHNIERFVQRRKLSECGYEEYYKGMKS
jgi:hypothetical protein